MRQWKFSNIDSIENDTVIFDSIVYTLWSQNTLHNPTKIISSQNGANKHATWLKHTLNFKRKSQQRILQVSYTSHFRLHLTNRTRGWGFTYISQFEITHTEFLSLFNSLLTLNNYIIFFCFQQLLNKIFMIVQINRIFTVHQIQSQGPKQDKIIWMQPAKRGKSQVVIT